MANSGHFDRKKQKGAPKAPLFDNFIIRHEDSYL